MTVTGMGELKAGVRSGFQNKKTGRLIWARPGDVQNVLLRFRGLSESCLKQELDSRFSFGVRITAVTF